MKARAKAKRGQPRDIQPSKGWEIAKVAAIILGVALPYLPALRVGFVWDDELLITAKPLLRRPSSESPRCLQRVPCRLFAGSAFQDPGGISAGGTVALRVVAKFTCRFEAPGQRQSVTVPTRDRPDGAILFDRHRLRLNHDLVSKSRHWRRRNSSWPVHEAFNQYRNGDLVVCQTSLSTGALDGGLSAMAIRPAYAHGLVAFDCTHRRTPAPLAATLARPSLCLSLLHHRAVAGDRNCAHVIRAERIAGGRSSPV